MQLLLEFLWSVLGLAQCWTVVDAYEEGVVLRLGKFRKTILPGFHWLMPLGIDRALTHEVILTTRQLDEQSLVTSDNKKIVISVLIAYTIFDIKKILLGIEEAETVLENLVYGIVADSVMDSDYATVTSGAFLHNLNIAVMDQAADLGMTIKKVVIVNLSTIKTIRLMVPVNPFQESE